MSKKQNQQNPQGELFKAEATWFHVFRDMIESGDVAAMGPFAVTIYLVIKSHTNFSTGRAFPSVDLIAEKSGISRRQVLKELNVLEEHKYIEKKKVGRNNHYTLREKVRINDDSGRPAAVATWDYLPSTVASAMADLRNVVATGDFGGAKIVHIDRLNVNITNVNDGGINLNVNELKAQLDSLPTHLRETLARHLKGENVDKSAEKG